MEQKHIKLIIGGVSLVVALLVFLLVNPFVIVSAGHRGVVLNWGAVSDKVLAEGFHFRVPIMQRVIKLDVRTVKYEVETLAYSKDLQTVHTNLALNYHLNPDKTNKVYQEIGTDFESRIINPAIQEVVKAVVAKFPAQELIEKRDLVKEEIKHKLSERLGITNMLVDETSIANFDFSDQYEKAIEAKQVAQQDALKAENELKRIKIEAEQRVAQAQAEAEAIKIQAQAITQQGGRDYVQLKAIEKWNGNLPQQMIPGGTVPFLDLSK